VSVRQGFLYLFCNAEIRLREKERNVIKGSLFLISLSCCNRKKESRADREIEKVVQEKTTTCFLPLSLSLSLLFIAL
jgi:hypothetical protein